MMPNADKLAQVFQCVRTERLTLRCPNADDSLAFFQVDGDPETNRFSPYGPAPDLAASEERLLEWLQRWQEDGYGYWALAVQPDTAVLGFGGVRRIVWQDQTVLNLYYKLQPTIWRRGYATELARIAVSLAQTHLPLLPIIARARQYNLASQRTAEQGVFSVGQTSTLTSISSLRLDGHRQHWNSVFLASAPHVARR
jgi:[ribosomal protein S5]-alanine N-acetyltransferase